MPPGLSPSPSSRLWAAPGTSASFRRHGGLLAFLIFGFRVFTLQSRHQSGPSPLLGPQSWSCGLFFCSFSLTSCKTHSLGLCNLCSCFRSNLNHFHSKVLFCPFFFFFHKRKQKTSCFSSSPSYSRSSLFFPSSLLSLLQDPSLWGECWWFEASAPSTTPAPHHVVTPTAITTTSAVSLFP